MRRQVRPRRPQGGGWPRDTLSARILPLREIGRLGDGDLADASVLDIPARARSTPSREATLRTLSETEAVVELLSAENSAAPGRSFAFHLTGGDRVQGRDGVRRGN